MSAGIAALVAQLAELTEVLRPVAARLAADVETSPAGRDTESSPEGPAVATTDQPGDERAEQIAGLRELADFLETHPEVPHYPYGGEYQVHVSNLPLLRDADEGAMFAELARIADALDVVADLRDEPGAGHPHATRPFRGGVRYKALHVTQAYRRGYKDADEDIPRGGEEVAGPDGEAGPATAPAEPKHRHVGGSAGGPSDGSAECACGVVFAGFDTHAEATAALDRHIADPGPKVQDWWFTFGSGQNYDGKYVVIGGTYDGARDVMLAQFGSAWSMQYSSAERAGVEQFGLIELPRDLWPARTDVVDAEPDPCPVGDPACETGDDGSCHDACQPATAPEWSPGAGLERVKRELPGIVPELTDDDMRKADEIIAAARPIVLVESPIPGGPPARAEVCEDKGGTTVKVIYCDSRTGARVARRRILGPAPAVESEG